MYQSCKFDQCQGWGRGTGEHVSEKLRSPWCAAPVGFSVLPWQWVPPSQGPLRSSQPTYFSQRSSLQLHLHPHAPARLRDLWWEHPWSMSAQALTCIPPTYMGFHSLLHFILLILFLKTSQPLQPSRKCL